MLDPLVPVAAYGAVLALAGLLRRRRALESLRPWQRAAKKVGLRGIEAHAPLFRVPHLVGRDLAHRRVHIERHENQHRHAVTRVLVAGNSGISLHPARWHTTAERRRDELGDERFDDHVWVHGPPEIVRALLDAETRDIVRHLLGGRLEMPGRRPLAVSEAAMANGELSVTLVEHTTPPSVHKLEEAIETLLELAQRLERPPEVASRLAANLEHEPHWRVRLRGLEVLATNYPTDPATISAMRHGLRDQHPTVRLQAAVTLGEEGRDTLLAIATGDVDDGDSARAIELLGERLPAALALSLVRQALQTGRVGTADAGLSALGRVKSAEAGELLSKVLASESGRLALAAAHALGERGAPDGEPPLLAALQRDEPDLLIPVAEALGRCGSAHAVLPLQELAEVASPELRRAALKSVTTIQSRLTGTSPGQLSLADARSGELTLADDDPRGRLSLPAMSAAASDASREEPAEPPTAEPTTNRGECEVSAEPAEADRAPRDRAGDVSAR